MESILSSAILAQNSGGGGGGVAGCMIGIIVLAIMVVAIIGMWKMFAKAGQPGWGAIVPFYNAYILCKIGGRPGWWFILMIIPFIGIIFWFIICIDVAKSFGKGVGFGIASGFFYFITFPILGFGDAQYQGPVAG